MTKAISIFVYDKEDYKIAIKRWRVVGSGHPGGVSFGEGEAQVALLGYLIAL